MHANNNSLTTRKRRLTQICYERADTLYYALNKTSGADHYFKVTSGARRAQIAAAIARLAEKAKVVTDDLRTDQIYIESLRALAVWKEQGKPDLSEVAKDEDAALLAKLSDSIRKKATNRRRAERAKQSEQPQAGTKQNKSAMKAKKGGRAATFAIEMREHGAGNIGYIQGKRLLAEEATDTLKVSDAAAAWQETDDHATAGRVVSADAETFTIRDEDGEETTFKRATCAWAGRITGTLPTLPQEQLDKLRKLRAKLEALGNEDDQIIRCSARYELEKQIYDIEYPPAGLDDWSEWEEEEEAAAV